MDRINWKEELNKRRVYTVFALEFLFLAAGIWGLFHVPETVQITSGQHGICLTPGVYNVQISYYASGEGNVLTVEDYSPEGSHILFNPVNLCSGDNVEDCQMWVLWKTDKVRLEVNPGEGELQVYFIEIQGTGQGSRIWIFMVLCISFFINLLIFVHIWDRVYVISWKKKTVWAVLAITVLFISVPSFVDYNIWGHDWGFHALRVEGLISGLKDGQFPVRIQGNWLQGYGYAASVFYSDLFLTIPAFLRWIGFPVYAANAIFMIVLNGATVIVAYKSFQRCFSDEVVSCAGAVAYAGATYRLYDVYMRAALGEVLALLFLPVVLCGFYCILTEDIRERKYKRNWIWLTVGMTGIIHSHVLTCEMLALTIIPLCLSLWKRVFRKETFMVLFKALIATLLINLWYLVPFLDYFLRGEFHVGHFDTLKFQSIQEWGTMPAHLLFLYFGRGSRPYPTNQTLYESGGFGVGMVLLCPVFAWIWLEVTGRIRYMKKQNRQAGRMLFWLTILFFVLSSCYFPWNALQSLGGIVETLVLSIQFPYRFLGLACVTTAALLCLLFMELREKRDGRIYRWMVAACVCTACGFICYQTNQILMHHGFARVYEKQGMGNMEIGNGEYLPYKTDVTLLKADRVSCGDGVSYEAYEKGRDTLHITLTVLNEGEDSYVEVPLLYYAGYQAKDDVTGEQLQVVPGNNNVVRVLLPEGYAGRVRIAFIEPWYWRVAEYVSVAVLTVMICRNIHIKRQKERGYEKQKNA